MLCETIKCGKEEVKVETDGVVDPMSHLCAEAMAKASAGMAARLTSSAPAD